MAAILDSAPTRDHDDLTKVVNAFLASEHPQRERQLAGELRAAVGRFAEFDDEQTADPSPELYESFDELLSILNAAADQFDASPSTSAAAVHLAPAPPAPPAPTPGPFHLRNDFLPARTATPPPPPPAVPLTWGLRQSPRAQQLADACSQQLREEAALQVFRTALILRNFRLAAGGASRRRLQLATR